jgi:hypothetical protein
MASPSGIGYPQGYLGVNDGDSSLLQRMEAAWQESSPLWLQFQAEADVDTRMAAGDQEALFSYGARTFNYWRRNQFSFNKLRPAIQMISGHQRRTRKSSIIIPQDTQDQDCADQLSKSLMWSMQHANSFNQISEAFESAITTGLSLLYHWLDYSQDPVNGDVRSSVMRYSSILMDPFFKRLDLSDCRYIWTRKWLSKNQIKILLPDQADKIESIHVKGNTDGRFPYLPEAINYQQRNLLIYDEFWYADTRKKSLVLDENTGETFEWRGEKDEMQGFFEWGMRNGLRMKKITQEVPTIHYGVAVQHEPILDMEAPDKLDRYPFAPFVCFFQPEIPYMPMRLQGIVRNARDAQWAYNRRAKLNLDYLEAGINRGFIYPEDVPVNPDSLTENKGNGMNIPIKAGRDPMSLREIMPAQLPPSWFQEMDVLEKDVNRMLQVSEELMGSAEDDKAGVLSMLRQGAGLTMLNPLFDKLDESQKNVSQIHLDLMQNNWKPGKFERIIGEPPHPYIKNKYFTKFDISIVDGNMTPTQQWMEFQQMMEMRAAQIPIPDDLLVQTAPLQNKKRLMAYVKQQQEAAQQQAQQAQQIQMKQMQEQSNLFSSQAEANRGLAIERRTRVAENQALAIERVKKAEAENEQAKYDKAKAIKELADMDLAQIERALAILRALEEDSQAQQEEPTPSRMA